MFGRERMACCAMLTDEDWANNRFNKRLKHHLRDVPLQRGGRLMPAYPQAPPLAQAQRAAPINAQQDMQSEPHRSGPDGDPASAAAEQHANATPAARHDVSAPARAAR